MAVLPPKGRRPHNRGPSIGKSIMVDTVNGSPRVRKWPRRRTNRSTEQLTREATFKASQMAAKWMAPQMLQQYTDAVRGTPLLPRDLITAFLYNRLAAFVLDDGRTLYPMPARSQVSQSLDTITQTPGALLIRGDEGWQALTPEQYRPHGVFLTRTTDQHKTAGFHSMEWQAAPYPNADMWDVSNPAEIIADVEGWYVVSASINQGNASGNNHLISLKHNGNDFAVNSDVETTNLAAGWLHCTGAIWMDAGEIITASLYYATSGVTYGPGMLCVMAIPFLPW